MSAAKANKPISIKEWTPSPDIELATSIFFDLEDSFNNIETGVPYHELTKLVNFTGLSDTIILSSLGFSSATISRRRKEKHLRSEETDRLYRFAEIISLATNVFDDKDKALQWLQGTHKYLSGKTALKAMETETGASEVENLLLAIEHGIYL